MAKNEFYSTVLRKKIIITSGNITKQRSKNGRNMLVGTYKVGNKTYKAYKFT